MCASNRIWSVRQKSKVKVVVLAIVLLGCAASAGLPSEPKLVSPMAQLRPADERWLRHHLPGHRISYAGSHHVPGSAPNFVSGDEVLFSGQIPIIWGKYEIARNRVIITVGPREFYLELFWDSNGALYIADDVDRRSQTASLIELR